MPNPDSTTVPLDALVELVTRLHRDHTVSYVAAGDDRIYAYGGNGFCAVVSQELFADVVELETPTGRIRVQPDESGSLTVAAEDGDDPRPVDERIAEATRAIDGYYRRRYWG
jgi:hypothetical protein